MELNFKGWQQIYKPHNKTNCQQLRNKSGVYCLALNDVKNVIYVGKASTDLEDVVTRHFQKGNVTSAKFDRKKGDFFLNVCFLPPKKAADAEIYLIGTLQPDKNIIMKKTLFDKLTIFKRYTGIEKGLVSEVNSINLYGEKTEDIEVPF